MLDLELLLGMAGVEELQRQEDSCDEGTVIRRTVSARELPEEFHIQGDGEYEVVTVSCSVNEWDVPEDIRNMTNKED